MSSTLSRPPHLESNIRRVAILFAGGPAPAANAVISTAAVSFLRNNIDVVGILHGYSHLVEFASDHPMVEGRDYIRINHTVLKRTRNSQGIIDRHRADQSRQGRLRSGAPEGPAADRPVEDRLRRAGVDGRRRPDFHRRRRHAEDGQQVQALPGAVARRTASGFPSSTCRRRSTTTTWASTSRSATSRPSTCLADEIRNLLADAEASRATSWPRRWAAAPAGWPTARPSPAKPAW